MPIYAGSVVHETRILTHDLRWVPAGSLERYDKLVAFDENTGRGRTSGGVSRLWRESTVEEVERMTLACYDLTFNDGTRVRCSEDNQWLTCHGCGAHWMTTKKLVVRDNQGSNVVKPLHEWDVENSREGGYLAAAFDGEGCFTQRNLDKDPKGIAFTKLSFAQKENDMKKEVIRCLAHFRFPFTIGSLRKSGVHYVNISHRKEVLRFLGSIRPQRLIAKFNANNIGQMASTTVKLVDKTYVGVQPVVALKTSSRTFLAAGLASLAGDLMQPRPEIKTL